MVRSLTANRRQTGVPSRHAPLVRKSRKAGRTARARPGQRDHPGLVFNYTADLDHVADPYAAMDECRAIKSLLAISQP